MKRSTAIIGFCISFVTGSIITYAAVFLYGSLSKGWINLDKPSDNFISYSEDALFKSDIALPDIKQLSGKTKFITNDSKNQKLGYIVHVDVLALDLKKVPIKYLKDKSVGFVRGQEIKRPAIKQVVYEVIINFTFKDKDGFSIDKFDSEKHTIESGKDNELQSITLKGVTAGVAARTHAITMELHVQKCITCIGE